MNAGRWYPTNTSLGNGDLLVVSGSTTPGNVNTLPQVFQDKTQTWRSLTSATRNLPLYPMMIQAPDGRVFNAGPNQDTEFLTVTGTGAWSAPINNIFGSHDYGAAIVYDEGKVVLIGGGHPAADAGGGDNFNQEIYSPPYLFKGARPSVTTAPTSAANGQTIFVQTPDSAGIGKVHLIRLNAITHSFDQNQRIVRLAFTK